MALSGVSIPVRRQIFPRRNATAIPSPQFGKTARQKRDEQKRQEERALYMHVSKVMAGVFFAFATIFGFEVAATKRHTVQDFPTLQAWQQIQPSFLDLNIQQLAAKFIRTEMNEGSGQSEAQQFHELMQRVTTMMKDSLLASRASITPGAIQAADLIRLVDMVAAKLTPEDVAMTQAMLRRATGVVDTTGFDLLYMDWSRKFATKFLGDAKQAQALTSLSYSFKQLVQQNQLTLATERSNATIQSGLALLCLVATGLMLMMHAVVRVQDEKSNSAIKSRSDQ